MHLQPVLTTMRATLAGHAALAGDDPAIDQAVAHLTEALEPMLRLVAMELAQQAAAEVAAQLPDRTVDVVLNGGDPELRVGEATGATTEAIDEDFDARITLRLPPTLKRLIEDSANGDGESVNAWVVEALNKRAKKHSAPGTRVTDAFDL